MSEHNKAIVGRWLDEFWNKGNVGIVDELGAPAVLMYYPLTGELRGRAEPSQLQGAADLPRFVEESVKTYAPAQWYMGA